MNKRQLDLFWNEIALIRQRHGSFFPKKEIKNIILPKEAKEGLRFKEGHELSGEIILEIQFAWKLAGK